MPEPEAQNLRDFMPGDLEAVEALVRRTIAAAYAPVYSPEAVAFFERFHTRHAILADAVKGVVLVAEADGNLAATGTVVGSYIKRVFVAPERQRQGLGRLVMAALEARAASQGKPEVRLDASLPSKAFYDALGYRTERATYLALDRGQRLDYYEMRKSLVRGAGPLPLADRIFRGQGTAAGRLFHFQQAGTVIRLAYAGGGVRSGSGLGLFDEPGRLDLRCQHVDADGRLASFSCRAVLEARPGGGLVVREITPAGAAAGLGVLESLD